MLKHRGAKIDTKHIVQLTRIKQSENEYYYQITLSSGRVITKWFTTIQAAKNHQNKIIAEKAGL